MTEVDHDASVLLVDTCGERGSVAIYRRAALVAEIVLPERAVSTGLLGAVREVLATVALRRLEDLRGVGVVNGPGSFTGVRVGLAVVKGLCEAASLPVAAVSRLSVLAHAGDLRDGFALLRAGRDEVYLREQTAGQPVHEAMVSFGWLRERRAGREILCCAESLQTLAGDGGPATLMVLSARHAFPLVWAALQTGETELAMLDANYVRDEQAIYRRSQPACAQPAPAQVGR